MPKILETKRVIAATRKLISIAREVSVPIVVTEHVPDKLKPIIPDIATHLGDDYKPITKTTFSCWGEPKFREALEALDRKTLLLVGIETHICVLQTALEARAAGYRVFVAADGVSCRNMSDHGVALGRMTRAGVELVTWEMVAYEWMRSADSPEFKRVLPHIKSGLV